MSKKTKQDATLDELTKESEIQYDLHTYAPVWNETFQRYDIFKILISSGSEQTKIIREPTKFQHDYQIHAEILKRLNEDFVKRRK